MPHTGVILETATSMEDCLSRSSVFLKVWRIPGKPLIFSSWRTKEPGFQHQECSRISIRVDEPASKSECKQTKPQPSFSHLLPPAFRIALPISNNLTCNPFLILYCGFQTQSRWWLSVVTEKNRSQPPPKWEYTNHLSMWGCPHGITNQLSVHREVFRLLLWNAREAFATLHYPSHQLW